MATVDFYFDFQSPWAYLASTRIERLCAEHATPLNWWPVELDRVKELVGRETVPYDPVTMQYVAVDVQRWAHRYGVPVSMPVRVPTTPVLRGCFLARDAGCAVPYIHRVFRAYWGDGEDLSDETVIRAIAADCGLEADVLFRAFAGEDTADRLDANNRAAADRGVFGVPMIFVDEAMFWGNDRLDFVAEALAAAEAAAR